MIGEEENCRPVIQSPVRLFEPLATENYDHEE